MKIKGLQVIFTTGYRSDESLLHIARQTVLGGVDSVQLRHKGSYTRDAYLFAVQLAGLCRSSSVPLIVNDRIDIALALSASGVHLGQSDIPIVQARRLLGDKKIIGATASSLEQAKQAQAEGADYIGLGHIFPTKSKHISNPPLGLQVLADICRHIRIPVLAIGGIRDDNLKDVCAAGVQGVAVISAICASMDPLLETQKLKHIIKNAQTNTY